MAAAGAAAAGLPWSLLRGLKYEQAKGQFEPFNQCVAPDPATRDVLARLIAATVKKGMPSFVTINNKAEGCAPLSVQALAGQVAALLHEPAEPEVITVQHQAPWPGTAHCNAVNAQTKIL